MGNYVDTTQTRPVTRTVTVGTGAKATEVGVCGCPGKPHDADTAEVRVKLGYGELAIFRQAGWIRSKGQVFSNEDAKAALLALGVRSWNLINPDGSSRKVSSEEIERLDEDTVDWLFSELQPAIKRDPLPNQSGAPSPGGRQESAGPTRTKRERRASTST